MRRRSASDGALAGGTKILWLFPGGGGKGGCASAFLRMSGHGWTGTFPGNGLCPEISPAPRRKRLQQRVWKLLCEIPYGGTTTYGGLAGRLAEELGRETMSSQAVGGAVGRNPISIVVPVTGWWDGTDGFGYAGGLTVKKWLLDHEGAELTGHARKG